MCLFLYAYLALGIMRQHKHQEETKLSFHTLKVSILDGALRIFVRSWGYRFRFVFASPRRL